MNRPRSRTQTRRSWLERSRRQGGCASTSAELMRSEVCLISVDGVTEPQRAFFHSVHRTLRQPLERRLEENRVRPLPHRVVRRAAEIDEDFFAGAEVHVELADA